ncbi:DUF3857 domain-containing protein [Aquimarina sp. SS2-1]|uniref:DUF3857 domain-containing protein n=1 Tax=Aquimarina besae TaxID=3342247 RepID=UPI0036711B25
MHRFLLFTFFILLSFFSISQENYNYKSLVVSIQDLKGETYKQDTTANAFYVYEKGYSRIENGGRFNLLTNYSAKIKILNSKGFEKGTVKVLLFHNKNSKEFFRDLKAITYNLENGEIVKTALKESNIYKEKYNENYTLVKFTFPNLKPGSVITYSYQTESPFLYNFNGWDFQDDIPKLYSEYEAELPGNYVYNIRLIGNLKLDSKENSLKRECIQYGNRAIADCSHSRYIMKNIPAFKEEKFMTAKKNYFSRVEYELKEHKKLDGTSRKFTETWKNVDKELKKDSNVGLQLKKTNVTKDLLPETIAKMSNDLSKAKQIYKHVTQEYTWNDKYKIFKDVSVKNLIASKVGNVSEINILLHNIYKEQGFSVKPVLLSTRNNGYATRIHPVLSDFNYLIVQLSVEDKTYLLDATEKKIGFGQVPFRCLNQYARLLDFKNGSSWIEVKPQYVSSYYYKEKIKLNDKLMLEGTSTYTYSGYHAYSKREKYDEISEQQIVDKILNPEENLTIVKANIKNLLELEKPLIEEISFKKSIEKIEDLIYIKPFTKPFFTENPFKLNKRTYPVDFGYKDSYSYIVFMEIPEDYDFIDIPKNQNFILPGKSGRLSVNFQLQENILIINHSIRFTSSYYPVEYYDSLKEFFNLIVDMENNTVVTIKKTS